MTSLMQYMMETIYYINTGGQKQKLSGIVVETHL